MTTSFSVFHDRRGASAAQSLILIGLVALASVVAFRALGETVSDRADCAGKAVGALAAVQCKEQDGARQPAPGGGEPTAPAPDDGSDEGEEFDAGKELADLALELLGINDAVKCFTEGDILACALTLTAVSPFKAIGIAVKLAKNAKRIQNAVDRFIAARNAKKAKEAEEQARRAKEEADRAAAAAKCKNGKCDNSCFAAGTLVHSEGGAIPIEELQVGDRVWSRDDRTGAEAYRPVARTVVTPDQPLLALSLEDSYGALETLEVTPPHPFHMPGYGWIAAGDLLPGDLVQSAGGGTLRVADLVDTGRTATVYNFEVEEFHTYFVGENAAWVHNECLPEELAKKRAAILECLRNFLQNDPIFKQLQQQFPGIKFGLGGSIARGTVGNPNKPNFGQPFDPNKFDLDLFVVADDFPQPDKVVGLQGARDRLKRSCPGPLSGLKPGGAGLSIKVFRTTDRLDPSAVLF